MKVKGHVGLQHLVQLKTQERFTQEASTLVGRLMSRRPLSIIRLVGERSRSNVKPNLDIMGNGALVFYKPLLYLYTFLISPAGNRKNLDELFKF